MPSSSEPATAASGVPAEIVPAQMLEDAVDDGKRRYVVGVVAASHFMNHIQGGVGAVLLPVMMNALGFDLFQLGMLNSMYQLASTGMQVIYGILAQYFRRSVLLGIGNIIVGTFAGAMGITTSYGQVLGVRICAGLGASAQHPLGTTILARYFRQAKGQILGLHNTAGNLGALVAPLLVVAMLSYLDWRNIWMILAVPSVLMGFAYFFFGDAVSKAGEKKGPKRLSFASYIHCLKNRDVMVVSAIQMVGAAGRGTDINTSFFVPFFMVWMGVDLVTGGLLLALLQVGGVLGPACIGWLSDRTGRRVAIFSVLTLSMVFTISLLLHAQITPMLFINLLLYGAVVNSRESLTQSMIADGVQDEHADAAFSLYYFIGFVSGPAWTALTGYLIQNTGWVTAFIVVGVTYLNGIWLIALLNPKKKGTASATS